MFYFILFFLPLSQKKKKKTRAPQLSGKRWLLNWRAEASGGMRLASGEKERSLPGATGEWTQPDTSGGSIGEQERQIVALGLGKDGKRWAVWDLSGLRT